VDVVPDEYTAPALARALIAYFRDDAA